MALRTRTILSLALFAAVLPLAAQAQSPAPSGDAKRGHALAYTCNGCHAIPNYKNVYPTYSVPKLHGQRPEYLVAALKAYKSGERSHGTMHSQASSMSEQDMIDVSAYLAGPDVLTASSPKPADGKTLPQAAQICTTCHGANGVGITADFPTISGQHRDYLVRSLLDYKKGGRKNPIMAPQAASLTNEDITALADYYAAQTPALQTVPKKQFFFSSSK